MYDPGVTAAQIEAVVRATGKDGETPWKPEYHSFEQIQSANRHFCHPEHGLWDYDKRDWKRKLQKDEQVWIDNERRLGQLDFNYWCNTPEAPIWMADGTFKPIGEIKPGDVVVGWSRPNGEGRLSRNKTCVSVVEAVQRRIAPIIRVSMSSGNKIRCTPDHLWASGATWRYGQRANGKKYAYLWTRAYVGAWLRKIVDPVDRLNLTREELRAADWLAGVFDGEGSADLHGGLSIAQYRSANPEVHSAIGAALRVLGLEFTESERQYTLTGGRRGAVKFLALTRPIRSQTIIERTIRGEAQCERDRVEAVDPEQAGEVVSLQTSTGNYVAWGYQSRNCTMYPKILDWQDRPINFRPNIAQRITLDIWAECERNRVAISEQALKARQLGKSTITELAVAHRVQFWPHTHAVVASSDPDKSELMVKMLEFALDSQPCFMVPMITGYSKGERIEFGRQNCTLSIQHGSQLTGIARGTTPTVAHLSECVDFQNPEKLIDAALLRAMHESPFMFLVLESTGAGRHNWWHRTWEYSKAHWKDGMSRLRPTFMPWYIGTDLYPTEAWIRARPVPKNWKPEDLTIKHAEKAADYVANNQLLRKYLGDGWRMPIEQQWFWEVTRLEYKDKGILSEFYSELTADDSESFQTSVISVFDADIIAAYREQTQRPRGAFKLKGPSSMIHPRHWPQKSEIISTLPVIPIDQDYQLVPVRFDDQNVDDPIGKILIFEWPEDEEEYGLGFDASHGLGQDRSALEALRKGNMRRNDAQVAEFVSDALNASEMVPYTHALGKIYSRRFHGAQRQCKMVIEMQAGGNLAQLELRKMGWRNFHRWLRAYDQKVLTRSRSQTLGWATNQWSRDHLIVTLMTYVRSDWIHLTSKWFIEEMADLESDENTQKIKAQHGAYDDRIMALGMVLFSLHDVELRAGQQMISRERVADADPEYVKWSPGWQGKDLPGRSPVLDYDEIIERANY